VERLNAGAPRLFGDDRPVVLYNPHFDPKLSSWPRFGLEVLQTFAAQRAYNLVFAPHLRLFQGRRPQEVEALRPFLHAPGIHIDLGATSAAIDMTYANLADVYLGDASSQVYEVLLKPRPCIFLDAHASDWRGNESYRHWRFGPVIEGVDSLILDIAQARRGHGAYLSEQLDNRRYTFDLGVPDPSVRAADAIARLVGHELYANDEGLEAAPALAEAGG
jgi:hypothetical protein